jgi:hypothetical protein
MKKRGPGVRRTWGLTLLVAAAIGIAAYLAVGRSGERVQDAPVRHVVAPPMQPTPARGGPIPGPGSMSGLSDLGRGQVLKVVDLNSATLAELQTLPGITPAYATLIVTKRPYRSMEDVERAGIPRDILQQITPPAIIRVAGRGPLPQ